MSVTAMNGGQSRATKAARMTSTGAVHAVQSTWRAIADTATNDAMMVTIARQNASDVAGALDELEALLDELGVDDAPTDSTDAEATLLSVATMIHDRMRANARTIGRLAGRTHVIERLDLAVAELRIFRAEQPRGPFGYRVLVAVLVLLAAIVPVAALGLPPSPAPYEWSFVFRLMLIRAFWPFALLVAVVHFAPKRRS